MRFGVNPQISQKEREGITMKTIIRYYLQGQVPVTITQRKKFTKNTYTLTTKAMTCGCAVYATDISDAYEQFQKEIKKAVDKSYGDIGLEVTWYPCEDSSFLLADKKPGKKYKRVVKVESFRTYAVTVRNQEIMTIGDIFTKIPQDRLTEILGENF